MTENKRFVGRYAGRTIKKLIGIEDIETNRVCVTIDENIRLLNELNNENEQLKHECNYLQNRLDDFINIQKENEELKENCKNYTWYKQYKTLLNENEKLKQSSTMYYNLFKELQKQMQGVKSKYDLDSKDFEDLIELSKGNVFDDEIGWIHLPIKELQE